MGFYFLINVLHNLLFTKEASSSNCQGGIQLRIDFCRRDRELRQSHNLTTGQGDRLVRKLIVLVTVLPRFALHHGLSIGHPDNAMNHQSVSNLLGKLNREKAMFQRVNSQTLSEIVGHFDNEHNPNQRREDFDCLAAHLQHSISFILVRRIICASTHHS
jgi:hypothetical protein